MTRPATNTVVVENLDQTLIRMVLYSGYGQSGAPVEAWEEHQLISEAIPAKDPDAAAHAMGAHLTAGLGRIRKAIG
ncbi:FCD domain-containing protein [Nocardioides marmorisolisilvae]|uniref:FCD domain-containing protein n=1 Tax=Nocardioides marmorisolisilvae TaxID=1542737 RepID=A0A3N0DQ68_9ACTN|nr:FCD domain-containing protein [Nocardioides marmorisolisilvae]RNL77606.1 FCD domain-containing protein [Nocardioides marmorisolisilvae]